MKMSRLGRDAFPRHPAFISAALSVLLSVCAIILSERSHAQTNPLSSAEKDYESAVEYAYGMNKVRIDDTK